MKEQRTDGPELSPELAQFIIGLNEAGGPELLNAVANLVDQVGPEQAVEHLKRYGALIDFEEAAQRDPEAAAAAAVNNPAQIRLPLTEASMMNPFPVDRPGTVCEHCNRAGGELVARARTDGMGEEVVHQGACPPPACKTCGHEPDHCSACEHGQYGGGSGV